MQKFIAYILLTIFSINAFAVHSVKEDCCSRTKASHLTSSNCKKSCCTKENKSPKKHTHKCCQLIVTNQPTYAVNNNTISVEQSIKKATYKNFHSYNFQNIFEKFTINKNNVLEHLVLLHSPKKYIQYCAYLI